MSTLSAVDIFIVVLSIFLVFASAIYGALRAKSNKNQAEEYFLAGRSMPWFFVAASLFASNIGTEHFVGQAGSAAIEGIGTSLYEWTGAYTLLILGWIFAPIYLKAKLTTVPEYLERRFNKQCRMAYVFLTMVVYVVSKIGSALYAGGILLEVIAGLSIWISSPLIILATASYTVAGGLTGVMMTDTMQTLIFLIGGLIGTGFSLHLAGGLSGMFDTLSRDDIGLDHFLHVILPAKHRDFPWPGMLFGLPLVSIWYWCIDQEMVQRVLSARSLRQAQTGTAAAGLLKILPPFITVVPGMVARMLFELCRADSTQNTFPEWCMPLLSDPNEADKAYPLLVLREFPNGVRGIMVASFLAAMMSSLSSVFNSACTIFTYDIYERFFATQRPSSPEKLVVVGRFVTIGLTILTFCWLPVVQSANRGIYLVGQEAMTHLVPAASALFVSGMFLPFANGIGAFSGFLFGIVIGTLRYILYKVFQSYCDAQVDPLTNAQILNGLNWTICLNFNYFAIILFVLTMFVICCVSLFTERPLESQLQGLLSGLVAKSSQHDEEERQMISVCYTLINESYDEALNSQNLASRSEENRFEKTSISRNQGFAVRLRRALSIEDGYASVLTTASAAIGIAALIIYFW